VTVIQLLRSWKDPVFRQHPFDALDRMGDNLGYRHLHGPGSICLLAAAYDLELSERQQRMLWGILGAITCTLLATILYLLGAGTMIATGAGLLAAVDYRNIWTDVGPSPPHTLYLMLTMLLFTLGVVYWRSRRPWVLYAGAIVLALATMTFELAPAVVLSLAAGIAWEAWSKKALRAAIAPALRFVVLYLVTLMVLWPGGFLRGTVLVCIFGNFGVLLKWKHLGGAILPSGAGHSLRPIRRVPSTFRAVCGGAGNHCAPCIRQESPVERTLRNLWLLRGSRPVIRVIGAPSVHSILS